MNHGTRRAYDDHKCRCDLCVDAWNTRQRELRAKRATQNPETNLALRHGTMSTYVNHGCRCEVCVEAQGAANRRRYR